MLPLLHPLMGCIQDLSSVQNHGGLIGDYTTQYIGANNPIGKSRS
jgi:hypothetical protein